MPSLPVERGQGLWTVDLVGAGAGWGGISRYSQELQNHLAGRVRYYPSRASAGPLSRIPLLRNVPRCLEPAPRGQLVHFTQISGSAALLQRRPAVPVVVTVHDLGHLVWRPERATLSPPARFLLGLAFRALRCADRIIADSHFTRGSLVRHLGLPHDRIWVVPLGVDHAIFRPDPTARRRVQESFGIGCDDQSKTLIAVGTELPRKNLARLLQVVAAFRDRGEKVRLLKVGPPGGQRHRRSTLALIDRLRLDDRVIVIDRATDQELATLYGAADLYICASHLEGFGLPTLEALACGTPVVVSAAGALPELVGAAGAVVEVDSTAAWSAAIEAVLNDRARAERLRAAGQERARRFDWAETANATLDVYRELLDAGRPPRRA